MHNKGAGKKEICKCRQRGVALMLVLSAIVFLTAMGVEFAYNTNVAYHLSRNDYDRLRAYYLAKSAYSFMLLELKFDKTFQQVVSQQNLGQFLGQNAQLPLCQQFPISTGLIRVIFTGEGVPEGFQGGGGDEGEGGDSTVSGETQAGEPPDVIEEKRKEVGIGQEKAAEEFLSFEGDFDGECFDESTKIDLNGFAGLPSTAPDGGTSPFDQYKQFLFRFLSLPRYEDLFKSADVRVADVVTNIGDWIDVNADINPMAGSGGGAERSLYDRLDVPYSVRNGKLLTLIEAYLIEGVVDDWFTPLIDQFTVYGDGRVNVCSASAEIVESLIRRYVDATPSLPPLRLEDPEEMSRLVAAVMEPCASGTSGDQLKNQISQSLNNAIGAISSGESLLQAQPQQLGQTPGTGAGASNAGFAAYITTDKRFFGLKLTGQVQDTIVRIKAVVDVKDNDPKKWRLLYWRMY